MSTKHSKAAGKFLENKELAAWHDETLWMVRAKRDKVSKEVPEWEHLRDMASAIKMYSNSHLDQLLLEFEKNALANGAYVYWAKDADEYCSIVYNILNGHQVKHFIKSKSMLAEECGLNEFLEKKGIEVVESDLGERILQLMHKRPSHIVLPAIHVKKEEIGELFVREMGTEPGNNDQTYLTHAARKNLRRKFIEAEAAMTGANFAVASTGECVVCTNEGNADMGTSQPKLQITAFGMEKIVPDRDALGVFTRLLARSGTGQPITTYTSHYRKPRKGGELHIIIVDNGRSRILADQIYHWRQQLHTLGVASSSKKLMSGGMKFLMSRPALFNFALKNAPIVNSLPRGMIYNDLNDWGKEREIPEFAKESFNEMWKKNKVK